LKKFAVISDIHSNIYALKAVVEDARSKGVDTFINLGDILYGPIAPRETYEYLLEQNFITISGNQDRQIYEATKTEIQTNPTMQFILDELGSEPLEWMKKLPFDLHVDSDIYACHGTPSDDLVYLLEDISSSQPKVKTDNEILSLLGGITSPIILCGHTHIPRCVELSTGQIVINPGSVGLQAYKDEEPSPHSIQNYTSKASYVTLEKKLNGGWNISFHREDWLCYLNTGRV
jgi:predicted phosphodiesterase